MKNLNKYINERLVINSKSKANQYTCHPKNRNELKNILKERLKKDKNADLNDIDVSQIGNMEYLFGDLDPHYIDISEWDVSNVKNMYCMFFKCPNFNSDLSKWNISQVRNMAFMFYGCENFNCDLSNWNVSNITITNRMFLECNSLKKIPSWYKE